MCRFGLNLGGPGINSPAVPVCVNLQNGNNFRGIIDKFVVHQLVSILQ